MKKISIFLAAAILLIASLACQTIMGDPNTNLPIDDGGLDGPTLPPVDSGGNITTGGEADYPMPEDAFNLTSIAGTTNFQTKMSLDEAMNYYRDQFGKQGYTERDLLTVTSDTTFSMVFDGHESGQAMTVQGVDLGDGTINISITLSDF